MKAAHKFKIAQYLFALSIVVVSFSCNNSPEVKAIPHLNREADQKVSSTTEIPAAQKSILKVTIEGMTCAKGCAEKIEKEIAKLSGIGVSKVSFDEATAHFEYDKNALDADRILAQINSLNNGAYRATPIKETESEETQLEIKGDTVPQKDKLKTAVKEEGITIVQKKVREVDFPQLLTYFLKSLR